MADIDGFKGINDQLGHAAGDEVLRSFSQRARGLLRNSTDWMARYGGEEFAVILPETSLASAAAVAEKMRTAIASSPIEIPTGALEVTVSFGVSGMAEGVELTPSAEQLLQRADEALLASKKAGRNFVSIAKEKA
jgi:diguanylate cyclase (GGDEF)-like protein